MFDTILYTLMGFVSGTAFGGWAALSIHKARFSGGDNPNTKPAPTEVKGMPWRQRAREFDIPFKRLVQSGVGSGALEVSGYSDETFVLVFKCQHPDDHVDSEWKVLSTGLLTPSVDIYRSDKTYTYSEFLALGLEGEDPMELVRDSVESHRAIQDVERDFREEDEALSQLERELASRQGGAA